MEMRGLVMEQFRDTGLEQWQGASAGTASIWPSVSSATLERAPRFVS